jgi:hypothetical protein
VSLEKVMITNIINETPMTKATGHTLIASPCFCTVYKRVGNACMNFRTFEFCKDGWQWGAVMPTDGGLRSCQFSSFFLLSEDIDIGLPDQDETSFTGYVQDSDLPMAIANSSNQALEIVARRNCWRALNHPHQEKYRAHRGNDPIKTAQVFSETKHR